MLTLHRTRRPICLVKHDAARIQTPGRPRPNASSRLSDYIAVLVHRAAARALQLTMAAGGAQAHIPPWRPHIPAPPPVPPRRSPPTSTHSSNKVTRHTAAHLRSYLMVTPLLGKVRAKSEAAARGIAAPAR
eukprot:scaffold6716_cov114-Isochrysis_galbana.AAC.3